MMIFNKISKLVVLGLFSVSTLGLTYLAHRIATDPAPHIGADPQWITQLLFGLLLCVLFLPFTASARLKYGMVAYCVIFMMILYTINYFGILVEYGEWLDRGMQSRPF